LGVLLSIVVSVSAKKDLELPPSSADNLRWHCLRQLGLTSALSDTAPVGTDGALPLTASAFYEHSRLGRPVQRMVAGEQCWFRFSTLSRHASQAVLESIATLPGAGLELPDAGVLITGATCDVKRHPWAGQSSYHALAQERFVTVRPPPGSVRVRFCSPTAFVRYGPGDESTPLPVPLPELVFGDLLTRWNASAPLALPDEVAAYAKQCLAASRYRLHTVPWDNGPMSLGAIGCCHYKALDWDPYWMRMIWLLAGFGFYSGVGSCTGQGMGQIRCA
jgi:CRISPR/Cas system endoribonuclease Cas6 (RAMP superfamily)